MTFKQDQFKGLTQAKALEKGAKAGYEIRPITMFVMDLVKGQEVIRVYQDGSIKVISNEATSPVELAPITSGVGAQTAEDSAAIQADESAANDSSLVNRNVRGWCRTTHPKINWPARLRDHQHLVRQWSNREPSLSLEAEIRLTLTRIRGLCAPEMGPFALGQCYALSLHLCNLLGVDMTQMFDTVEYPPEKWKDHEAISHHLGPIETYIGELNQPLETRSGPLWLGAIHLARSLAVDFRGQPLAIREWGQKRLSQLPTTNTCAV